MRLNRQRRKKSNGQKSQKNNRIRNKNSKTNFCNVKKGKKLIRYIISNYIKGLYSQVDKINRSRDS